MIMMWVKRMNAAFVADRQKKGELTYPKSIFRPCQPARATSPCRRICDNHANADVLVISFTRYPLYKPCKCSGSIGLTHQDCLQSWLQVQSGSSSSGKCELCKTDFRFAPQYVPDAPDRLPVPQVIAGLVRCAISRWFPFLIRCSFALSLWLLVAPLITAYLYHLWTHRASLVMERFQWDMIGRDIVSGLVVGACIILSFLSIMNFADFLRHELQQPGGLENNNRPRRRQGPVEPEIDPAEDDIDSSLFIHSLGGESVVFPNGRYVNVTHVDLTRRPKDPPEDASSSDDDIQPFVPLQRVDLDMERRFLNADRNDGDIRGNARAADNDNGPEIPLVGARGDRNFDVDPDDLGDADINIALDELLGVRGPLAAVVRNLMWLIAFNAVYLAFFICVPRLFGASVTSFLFNSTSAFDIHGFNSSENASDTVVSYNITANSSLFDIIRVIEAESVRCNTTFCLSDAVSVIFGYLAFAAVVVSFKFIFVISNKISVFRDRGGARPGRQNGDFVADGEPHGEGHAEFNNFLDHLNEFNNLGDEQGVAIVLTLNSILDVMTGIVKVGLLLMIKMFLLPIALGFCLDAATLSFLGSSLEERVVYAGQDLFSFSLVHWVAGITFMLLVTVSVLQLREAVHPQLLAQVIRPQEPQPDLLGNLMHESMFTHAKRMTLSLMIYAVLMALLVHVPIRFILPNALGSFFSSFRFRTSYWMIPQLQVPLELLGFHLCVLGLLEKNKNSIGELQYHWLKLTGRFLGISDVMLPRRVEKFRLVGTRPCFMKGTKIVLSFWLDLASEKVEKKREDALKDELNLFIPSEDNVFMDGVTKGNGERVLDARWNFIRLPVDGNYFYPNRHRSILLPAKIGRFRLKLDMKSYAPSIQLWEEIPGGLIPRPPEGWDDLGIGGADVQGRWAWGHEKRSNTERGVAFREPLFDGKSHVLKKVWAISRLIVLAILSWAATVFALFCLVLGPAGTGRAIYYILRVPDRWVHDPSGFAIGGLIFFPVLNFILKNFVCTNESNLRKLASWLRRYHSPPVNKAITLMFSATILLGVAPLLTGSIVDMLFIKTSDWFMGKEPWVEMKSAILNWIVGIVALSVWMGLCVEGFLTRRFWRIVFGGVAEEARAVEGRREGQDEPNGQDADARAAAWVSTSERRLVLSWQGPHGRVARFLDVWKGVLVDFEWDKVDPYTLLDDFCFPITRSLLQTFLLPCSVLLACFHFQLIVTGLWRQALVRGIMVAIMLLKVAWAYKHHISTWFEVAHTAARNERYMTGFRLLNHGE